MARGVPVVTAPEEIDITKAGALRAALLEAAAHGHGTLAVDMSRTQFCDSAGLNVLVRAHKRARPRAARCCSSSPPSLSCASSRSLALTA
jgi:anti-sigma B factor antagonist